ncbi:MAG: hypothetical protein KAX65_03600 [Caldilineaceae bacterium]|nr:hypothetical protein [Caldilineaceae bacterium]
MTEENVDRILRAMPLAAMFIFPLIMLFATMFPRGLRLPLGRWVLRIAPPAAYFVSYYSARRWRADVCGRFVGIADEMDAIKSEQDAMTAEILRFNAETDDEIGLVNGDMARLAVGMFLKSYTNYDAVLSAAIAAAIGALREKLAQPHAATTAGVLDQVADVGNTIDAALGLIRTRMDATQTFGSDSLHQAKGMAIDSLIALEQRSQAGAAQIAAIEAEVAEVTQQGPGRPPKRVWSDDEIRELHAAYLVRDEQTAAQFATRKHLTESQMFKLFRRVGITKKGSGNYDSEF